MSDLPYSLMSELDRVAVDGNPPVHLWHPEHEKKIDLQITEKGEWFYGGTAIKRPRLIRLFASVLRKDGDDYFLVTPVEKCQIEVVDVPFQILLMESSGEGEQQIISLTTDMGEQILLDADHPLTMRQQGEESVPYVMVRGGMQGRVNRNVFYQMGELLVEREVDGALWHGLWSHGNFIPFLKSDAAG